MVRLHCINKSYFPLKKNKTNSVHGYTDSHVWSVSRVSHSLQSSLTKSPLQAPDGRKGNIARKTRMKLPQDQAWISKPFKQQHKRDCPTFSNPGNKGTPALSPLGWGSGATLWWHWTISMRPLQRKSFRGSQVSAVPRGFNHFQCWEKTKRIQTALGWCRRRGITVGSMLA